MIMTLEISPLTANIIITGNFQYHVSALRRGSWSRGTLDEKNEYTILHAAKADLGVKYQNR